MVEELNYLLLQSIGIWLLAVSCLLIFCACGDWISIEAFKITTATYNSLWYHHAVPLDNRKFNILILAFAQKPININGLSVVQCSLQSFLSVCEIGKNVLLFADYYYYYYYKAITIWWLYYVEFIIKCCFFQFMKFALSVFMLIRNFQSSDKSISWNGRHKLKSCLR